MRVCPSCGYRDPPEWRTLRWNTDIDYCHIDDFKRLKPHLAEKLLSGEKVVIDTTFAYALRGKGKVHIHRIEKSRFEEIGLKAFHSTEMEHVQGHTGFKEQPKFKMAPYTRRGEWP